MRWKGARGCKTGLEKRQFLAKVAANMDSMMVRKAGPLFGYLPKYFCKFSKYISAVCSAFEFTLLGKNAVFNIVAHISINFTYGNDI